MDAVFFALGLFLIILAFWDLFETVIVPRPTPGWFRIARYVVRGSWRVLRAVLSGRSGETRDRILGLFAPAMVIALLVSWLTTLIVGYGLVLYALRDELHPVPPGLGHRPSRCSRTTPSWAFSIDCRTCSSSGSDGRSKSSTRTSRTHCSASSARATTTSPGSARSAPSSTPPASS